MKSKIWRLEELASQYLSLIPHDLQYFGQHFVGVYLPDNWTPPSITINGKSKKLADIISWMIQSPVISEKMKNILQDLCGDSVQFLRFHDLKNKPYYAMNVLAVVPIYLINCLISASIYQLRRAVCGANNKWNPLLIRFYYCRIIFRRGGA